MKILLVIYSRNDNILQITRTLRNMGNDVICWYSDQYITVTGYLQKKLYKWGYTKKYDKYIRKKREDIYRLLNTHNPDKILFVNTPTDILNKDDIEAISHIAPTYVWCVDGISNNIRTISYYCEYVKKVSLFEPKDADFLRNMGYMNVAYVPVGYNQSYKLQYNEDNFEYDITFIGTFYRNRLNYMERVVKYAIENKLKIYVAGPLYEKWHFWKKIILRYKYPYLMQVAQNICLEPDAIAKIYNKSKICINIHSLNNEGLNPRVFEIMATGSLLLTDVRKSYYNLINPCVDCDVFTDYKMLINKLRYYLGNEDKRKKLSIQGKMNVINNLSLKNSLLTVLKE